MAVQPEVNFRSIAKNFIKISELLRDQWELNEWEDFVYLRKQVLQRISDLQPRPNITGSASEPGLTDEIEDEDAAESDNACLAVADREDESLKFDYHVLYNDSYCVPVLYFNVYRKDGSLVSLDEVWNLVPQTFRERLTTERWTFITQQEHPYLGQPFYQLHPCHTATLRDQMTSKEESKTCNFLISWLSAVGPVVHLNLPMEYGLHVDGP